MNLTDDQKKYLVPASIGAAVFVLCDEIFFKEGRSKKPGTPNRTTLIAAGASAVAGYFLYDKATPAAKADYDKYALPAGGASVAYAAVKRFAPIAGDRTKYALGAAAVAGYFAHNPPAFLTRDTVGMLPIFEPPFPPAFGPNFEPEFEG